MAGYGPVWEYSYALGRNEWLRDVPRSSEVKEKRMAGLPENVVKLLQQPFLAHVCTMMPDGSPQVTPMWVDTDGEHILVNTADGRTKTHNVRRDPRVAVSVADPENPITGAVQVRGTVTEITAEGADDHIDRLAYKYTGSAFGAKQDRLIFKIRPDSMTGGVFGGH